MTDDRPEASDGRVVIAPDKFRGTATAGEVAGAAAAAVRRVGGDPVPMAMSDGGEGLLDACGDRCPELVVTRVTGPDGAPVDAAWRLGPGLAVVEMARASGLELAGGPQANDPVAATSRGTGELLVAAARRVGPGGVVVLGMGGSATTDGGLGVWEAVRAAGGLGAVTLIGACDVDIGYTEAAVRFGPQKGADPGQVALLTRRLEVRADDWWRSFGIDVRGVPGAGAAGGTGGAVLVLGGQLRSGYRLVAELVRLDDALDAARWAVTGEGALDEGSFAGKVVGGVVADARGRGLATLVVVGRSTPAAAGRARAMGCTVVSLTERFGSDRAEGATLACVDAVVAEWLSGHPDGTT